MLLPPLNRDRANSLGVLLDQAPFVDIGKLRQFCEGLCQRLELVQQGKLTDFLDLLELQSDTHIVQWFFVNAGLFVVMRPGIDAWYQRHGYPPPDALAAWLEEQPTKVTPITEES